MKEFVEKLIEKLEETDLNDIQMVVREVLKKYGFPYESIVQDEVWDALDELSTNKFAIEIVNQLAEEYNQENDDTDYANIELYAFWQKHQWIPCSERLPDIGERVFVWVYGRVCIGKRIDAKLFEEYDIFSLENGSNESTKRIDAWQPLPAPYQP